MGQFYPYEITIIIILTVALFGIILKNYMSDDPMEIWSPTTMAALILLYYAVAGPTIALINEDTYYRLLDHREYFYGGWVLCMVSFLFLLFGFNMKSKVKATKLPNVDEKFFRVKKYGINLFIIIIICIIINMGFGGFTGQITFLDTVNSSGGGYEGAFRNYLYHAMNAFVPACGFLFLAFLKKRISWIYLAAFVIIALAIYTSQGFRWRHVLLVLTLTITYFCYKNKKPNFVFLIFVTVVSITAMGIIGTTRQYGKGLRLEKIEGKANDELFMEGFSEANVFMTTGLLVDMVPEIYDYIYFDPIVQSIAMPVPRRLWTNKPSGDYIRILESLYGESALGKGVAVLSFGEYYLAFGWIGVAIGSFLLGFVYKKLWVWFKANRSDPYVIVVYATTVSYLYVIISRGYMPQVTMLYFFTVFPAYIVYRIHRSKQKQTYRLEQYKKRLGKTKEENVLA